MSESLPSYQPTWDVSAFDPLAQALVDEAATYDGEVDLFDGDSHAYHVDQPLAAGSRWLDINDVEATRTTSPASPSTARRTNTNFLRDTVNRPGAARVLSWQRIPSAS